MSVLSADQRGDGVAVDEPALFVDDEHAIGIAVEGDAEVATMLSNLGLQVDHVLRFDRARRMVREASVELEVERHHLARQALEDVRYRLAGHPVAGVDGDLKRLDLRALDERQAVLREIVENVTMRDRPGRGARRAGALPDSS